MSTKPGPCAFCVVDECGHVCTGACDKQPTRTEFEAAAYRWLRSDDIEVLPSQREIYVLAERMPHTEDANEVLTESALDTAIAAAMGWPTVPEVKS